MKKNFVVFYSPGTFLAETSTREIPSWNTEKAVEMAAGITERYGAKPYGFRFITKSRGDDDLDSKITAESGFYYLGGEIKTIKDIEEENKPEHTILLANMRINGFDKVVIGPQRFAQPFKDGDSILECPWV